MSDTQKTFKNFLKKKTPTLEFYDASAMFIVQYILQFMLQLIFMVVAYILIADMLKVETSTQDGLEAVTNKFSLFTASTAGIIIITLINEATMILSPLAYWKVKSFNVFEGIGFKRKVNGGQIAMTLPVACLLLAGFMPVANLFVTLVYKTGYEYTGANIVVDSFGKLVLFLIVTAALPAVCEEILHRGMIARAGSKISFIAGLLLSSTIFAFMHGSPIQLVHQFFVGVVCALVYFMTGSIWIPVLVHFFNNAITLIASYINFVVNDGATTISIPWWLLLIMCIVGIGGLAGCLYAMYVISYRKRKKEDLAAESATENVESDALNIAASDNIANDETAPSAQDSDTSSEVVYVDKRKKKPIKVFQEKLAYLFTSPEQIKKQKEEQAKLDEQLAEYSPEKREVFYSMQNDDKVEIKKKNSRGIIFALVIVFVIWLFNTIGGYL